MPRIISVINQKGGVGKTTTAINLAAGLALKNYKVLLIDLDPQGNASTGVGINQSEREKSIYDLLIKKDSFFECIKKTKIENLSIIPANADLSGLETEVANNSQKAFLLKNIIDDPINNLEKEKFSYIIIDCPPSLSLLTIMSLVISHALVVPLQTEFFALEGLSQLVKTIDRIKINLNPNLEIQGIVLTMYDKRNKLCADVEKEGRSFFGNKVYNTNIPRNVRISEAPSFGMPVILYDKNCSGSLAYNQFVDEFLIRENLEEKKVA
jgi:chromosome partitioning protein